MTHPLGLRVLICSKGIALFVMDSTCLLLLSPGSLPTLVSDRLSPEVNGKAGPKSDVDILRTLYTQAFCKSRPRPGDIASALQAEVLIRCTVQGTKLRYTHFLVDIRPVAQRPASTAGPIL